LLTKCRYADRIPSVRVSLAIAGLKSWKTHRQAPSSSDETVHDLQTSCGFSMPSSRPSSYAGIYLHSSPPDQLRLGFSRLSSQPIQKVSSLSTKSQPDQPNSVLGFSHSSLKPSQVDLSQVSQNAEDRKRQSDGTVTALAAAFESTVTFAPVTDEKDSLNELQLRSRNVQREPPASTRAHRQPPDPPGQHINADVVIETHDTKSATQHRPHQQPPPDEEITILPTMQSYLPTCLPTCLPTYLSYSLSHSATHSLPHSLN
jgi:hypothetical protein